jgi:type II secretion system protein H
VARGFTLLEILVTLAVVGILAGVAMLRSPPQDGKASLERAGTTLQGAVRLAQNQALADGLTLALEITGTGYGFWQRDPRSGAWQRLEDRAALAPQALEEGLRLRDQRSAAGGDSPRWAALFYPNGEGTALWLRLQHEASRTELDLRGDGVALPVLRWPEDARPASTRFALQFRHLLPHV